jgi:ribose transport system substrate-binding protein
MKSKTFLAAALLAGAALFAPLAASAADVELLPNGLMGPASPDMVPAGKFKKSPPWVIGMSWPGVGNTWIVQTIQEIKYAASHDSNIKEFRFSEANWQPAKQVADIEDLMAHKVDALIIVPISPELVKAQVKAAVAAGIPVIESVTAGAPAPDATVAVYGGGAAFGKTGGEFLRNKLKGKGVIWAFRGIAGSGEETARYNGLREALKGSDIKIGAEVYGDWNYAKAKGLCENLVASGQPVDGIWFSGADMTRACFDVFKEIGKPLVPMTGEANNGFLRAWKNAGADSVGPIFTPGLGPATLRAAVALLKGEALHKAYISDPAPITAANFDKYYRPDLNDAYWFPSTLPEDVIKKDFKR